MSNRGVITIIVPEDDGFTHIPTLNIRDAWDTAQRLNIPSTNRFDFSAYTPAGHGTLQVEFSSDINGIGSLSGYSVFIDSRQRVTFLAPPISADKTIYGRYGDGVNWSNWFAIRVSRHVSSVTIEYGLADSSDDPTGTVGRLSLVGSLSGTFMTPQTTSSSPYWYFEIPTGYELVSIKNAGLGTPVDSANWNRIASTNRYVNRTPFEGYSGTFLIEIRRS